MAKKLFLTLLSIFSFACASGYKIPEQSLDSTALSGAHVAGSYGADASYYNPANMAFASLEAEMESALTYIHLTSVHFEQGAYKEDSKRENFLVPKFFYRSPAMGDWRMGLSFTTPAGLSKRWEEGVRGQSNANEFTLEVFELNPSLSYKISDSLALGLGIRGVYSKGIVKNDMVTLGSYQELKGDSLDFGWNAALAFKPVESTNLSIAYRSKVNLSIEGDAGIRTPFGNINPEARVTIPLPATLSLALAKQWDDFLVEFVWDRVYWSAYKELDFDYDHDMTSNPILRALDASKAKNWKDTNTYRLGLSYQMNEAWKLMAGFGIDKNPIPDDRLGFELPDSDAKIYSLGARYKINSRHEVGAAFLVSDKEDRTTSIGTFSHTQAHLLTFGYTYRY